MNRVFGPQLRLAGGDPDVPVLSVVNLRVGFPAEEGEVEAVRGISFQIAPGEALGLVGESGSGKTLCALSLVGLLPPGGAEILPGASIRLRSNELFGASAETLRNARGREAALVFQEAGAALNPVLTVGRQLSEVVASRSLGSEAALEAMDALLSEVGFSAPRRIRSLYPHQLSAGMAQRVQLALALAGDPDLLIADEPTASLDSVHQRQVLELLRGIQQTREMALLLISHDLALVGEFCHRVLVVYAGQVVEEGPAKAVLLEPRHPYTQALLSSRPGLVEGGIPLPIAGRVPAPSPTPSGCLFADRCERVDEVCRTEMPDLRTAEPGGTAGSGLGSPTRVRCWFPLEGDGNGHS